MFHFKDAFLMVRALSIFPLSPFSTHDWVQSRLLAESLSKVLSFISPSLQNATNWGIRSTSLYLHHFRSQMQHVFEVEKYQKEIVWLFEPTKETASTSILLFLSFSFQRRGQRLNFVSLGWTNLWHSTCFTCKCHFTLECVKEFKNRSCAFVPRTVKKKRRSSCFTQALGRSGSRL